MGHFDECRFSDFTWNLFLNPERNSDFSIKNELMFVCQSGASKRVSKASLTQFHGRKVNMYSATVTSYGEPEHVQ